MGQNVPGLGLLRCLLWVICTDFGLTADVRLGGDFGSAGPLLMVSAGKLMSEKSRQIAALGHRPSSSVLCDDRLDDLLAVNVGWPMETVSQPQPLCSNIRTRFRVPNSLGQQALKKIRFLEEISASWPTTRSTNPAANPAPNIGLFQRGDLTRELLGMGKLAEDWKPGSNVLRFLAFPLPPKARSKPVSDRGNRPRLSVADAQHRHLEAEVAGSADSAWPSITEARPPESTMALGSTSWKGWIFRRETPALRRLRAEPKSTTRRALELRSRAKTMTGKCRSGKPRRARRGCPSYAFQPS